MNISLPTGKVISVSYYQWLFILKEDEVNDFYQDCIADDLGTQIENPFNNNHAEKLDIEEDETDINL